jgi:hypothetical protein
LTTEDLIVIVLLFIIIILPYFCDRDFSEMDGSILIIFGGVIGVYMNLIHFFAFLKNHFRSEDIVEFCFSKNEFCPRMISETAKDNSLKLSGIIDLSNVQ